MTLGHDLKAICYEYLRALENMKHRKHMGSIHENVKEFSTLIPEISNMSKDELLFNFIDNLQSWAKQELRRRGV